MPACRITVPKTMLHQDLAEEYRRPDMSISPCTFYTEGQEFLVDEIGEKSEDFAVEGRGMILTRLCWS